MVQSASKQSSELNDTTHMTYTAGCIFEAEGSVFSRAGLKVGRIGELGLDRAMSADRRSFSRSAPMLTIGDWELKKERRLNGSDCWKLFTRNSSMV